MSNGKPWWLAKVVLTGSSSSRRWWRPSPCWARGSGWAGRHPWWGNRSRWLPSRCRPGPASRRSRDGPPDSGATSSYSLTSTCPCRTAHCHLVPAATSFIALSANRELTVISRYAVARVRERLYTYIYVRVTRYARSITRGGRDERHETGHTSCYTAPDRVPLRSFYMRLRWMGELSRRRRTEDCTAKSVPEPQLDEQSVNNPLITIDAHTREKKEKLTAKIQLREKKRRIDRKGSVPCSIVDANTCCKKKRCYRYFEWYYLCNNRHDTWHCWKSTWTPRKKTLQSVYIQMCDVTFVLCLELLFQSYTFYIRYTKMLFVSNKNKEYEKHFFPT